MKKIIQSLGKTNNFFSLRERQIEFLITLLDIKIWNLQYWSDLLNTKAKEKLMDSNNLSNLINEFKGELIVIYKEFQNLKKEILLFQNYEGLFKHLMCKNTEYKEEKDKECEIISRLKIDIKR